MPLVTIVVASTLAGEEITSNFLVGAELVLVGMLVGALLPSTTKPAIPEQEWLESGAIEPSGGKHYLCSYV